MSNSLNGTPEKLSFWLTNMKEHAVLIHGSIKPGNDNWVMVAENFVQQWQHFWRKIKNHLQPDADWYKAVIAVIFSFREFHCELLGAALGKKPVSFLTPTLLNHLLNELEEFLRQIDEGQSGGEAGESGMNEHLMWVLATAEHAAFLLTWLDPVDYRYRDEANRFESAFDKRYLQAVKLIGYYRSDPLVVQPVLQGWVRQTTEVMNDFGSWLAELKKGTLAFGIGGGISPLPVEHMLRETQYYLEWLAKESSRNFSQR